MHAAWRGTSPWPRWAVRPDMPFRLRKLDMGRHRPDERRLSNGSRDIGLLRNSSRAASNSGDSDYINVTDCLGFDQCQRVIARRKSIEPTLSCIRIVRVEVKVALELGELRWT